MTKEEREVMCMALEALTIFREWEMGQDYNSNRDTVLVRAFKAEGFISNKIIGVKSFDGIIQNKT